MGTQSCTNKTTILIIVLTFWNQWDDTTSWRETRGDSSKARAVLVANKGAWQMLHIPKVPHRLILATLYVTCHASADGHYLAAMYVCMHKFEKFHGSIQDPHQFS